MKRGDIYYIKSNFSEVGSEQHAGRPAVIVSSNGLNNNSEHVEIVYMTRAPKKDLPTHVTVRDTQATSTVLCEQVHTVSKQRLGDYMGGVTEQELAAIDTALAISLGLGIDSPPPEMREPTEEELEAFLAEKLKDAKVEVLPPDPTVTKLETERDLFRGLYFELLDRMTKGAPA